MKLFKKKAGGKGGEHLPDPGKDRRKLPPLPMTDKLKEKLKKSRKADPNMYPLW